MTAYDPAVLTVVLGRFDHPVVACGLGVILGDDCRIHVLASDLEPMALERVVAQRLPQVVVLDEADAREVLDRVRLACPATAIVVFARDPSPAFGKLLLAAGATCVGHSVSSVDLVAMVRLAAQGTRIFAPAGGERVERCYPSDAGLLTRREREVFVYLSKDSSYARIACELKITVRTAESYAARVRDKLRVRNRRELVGMPIPGDWVSDVVDSPVRV
jgi:DNA-binding NarL/FixJ family response regulator